MKWFQLDSDTPEDSRIEGIVRRVKADPGPDFPKRGWVRNAVHGALLDVWCYTASQDGARLPGYCERKPGQPIHVDTLARYADVPESFLGKVLDAAAAEGHIDPAAWVEGLIVFPAMRKRADIYTQRKLARMEAGDGAQGADTSVKGVRTRRRKKADIPVDVPSNRSSDLLEKEGGPDQVAAVVGIWNTVTNPPIPRVDISRMSDSRRRAILRVLKLHPDLGDWRALARWLDAQAWAKRPGFLRNGQRNPSYTGSHGTWVATIDWFLKPGKFQELNERRLAGNVQSGAGKGGESTGGKYGGLGARADGQRGDDPAGGRDQRVTPMAADPASV